MKRCTAAYMAPEQARGAIVDKRADIWAFGVVLYEMLTGKRLFDGETISDTLAAVLKTEPDWETVPAAARQLVRRCLVKDPRLRLRDIGDLRLILEEKADITLAPRAQSALLWKVLAGALALALVLAFLWRSPRPISQAPIRFNLELPEFATAGYGAGAILSPAILSPDGALLVYTGRGTDGKIRLYARPLDREQAAPMAGTEGAYGPFFSPDGQFVGFFAGGKLKKTSVRGGGTVALCDAPAGRGATWGADGEIIAALNFSGGLSGVSSEGGIPRSVTELRPEKKDLLHRWPQMLPGDRAVLYKRQCNNRPRNGA
jgi:serine/threonine-protein kinase